MAEFNKTPNPVAAPDYSGASAGIRASSDTSLGNLFAGLAGITDSAVKEQDRNIQENIQNDIFDEVDAVQSEFGVPEATDLQADADSPSQAATPLGVQRAGEQLRSLQSAYARGALKESHYWGRLNSMVRQLRGKYPGYRAEIDQMVSGVTGAKPANALRSALMQEFNAASEDAKGFDKFVERAGFEGTLPPDYFARQQSEDPYSENEVKKYVFDKNRVKFESESRKMDISLAESNDNLNKKTALRSYQKDAENLVNGVLADATSAIGKTYKQITDKVKEAQDAQAAGRPLPQAELEKVRGLMGRLKSDVRLALNQQFTKPWDQNPEHSYSYFLGKADMEDVIQTAMVPIAIREQALDAKNPWGVLGAQSAFLDAMKSDDSREILEKVPFAREMQAMSNTYGPEQTSQLINLLPQMRASLDQSLISYHEMLAARAKTNGENVLGAFDAGIQAERGSDYYNGLIESWTKVADQVSNREIPLEMVQNNVQYMFGADSASLFRRMDDSARYKYFSKVASPSVSRQMMKLKEMGDEESWNTYQSWVSNSFKTLFTQKVQGLQDLVVDRNHFRVSWDPTNTRFKLDLRLAGNSFIESPLSPNIDQLNSAIQSIAPIITEKGGDPSSEILTMLSRMGYNPNEIRPTMLNTLVNAIRERMSATQAGDAVGKLAGGQ